MLLLLRSSRSLKDLLRVINLPRVLLSFHSLQNRKCQPRKCCKSLTNESQLAVKYLRGLIYNIRKLFCSRRSLSLLLSAFRRRRTKRQDLVPLVFGCQVSRQAVTISAIAQLVGSFRATHRFSVIYTDICSKLSVSKAAGMNQTRLMTLVGKTSRYINARNLIPVGSFWTGLTDELSTYLQGDLLREVVGQGQLTI